MGVHGLDGLAGSIACTTLSITVVKCFVDIYLHGCVLVVVKRAYNLVQFFWLE